MRWLVEGPGQEAFRSSIWERTYGLPRGFPGYISSVTRAKYIGNYSMMAYRAGQSDFILQFYLTTDGPLSIVII